MRSTQPLKHNLELTRWHLARTAATAGVGGQPVHSRTVRSSVEACGWLVLPPVFNTGEVEDLGLEGSIPFRLRQRSYSVSDTVVSLVASS